MRVLINTGLVLLTLLYPFAVYLGIEHLQPRYLALVLVLVFALRVVLGGRQRVDLGQNLLLLFVVSLFATLVFISNSEVGLLFYPVLINLFMCASFAYTLFTPMSMIERFARLTTSDLPDYALAYARKVTLVWCGFFLLNALVAAYTALFCSLAVWSLYNGLIAYGLVALLFVAEYPVRLLVQKRHS